MPADALVSDYLPGISVNATAVVGRDRVHLGWPSIQLVGLLQCAPAGGRFGYCGNDFNATSDLSQSTLHQLFDLMTVLGTHLRTVGFLGLFGVVALPRAALVAAGNKPAFRDQRRS